MKTSFNLAVAAVFFVTMSNFCFAQSSKNRNNKEVLMETSITPENRVLIKWVSQEGHQTARFIIQRSRDNEIFFDIREIEVTQEMRDKAQRLQFAFTDSKILRNQEHYRITEYETDGQSYVYSTMTVKPESPVSVVRRGDVSIVRVMVEDSKNLTALVSTESGLGVPCEFEVADGNDVILRPAYSLNGGNYLVKLRSSTGEKQYKFSVKSDDVL